MIKSNKLPQKKTKKVTSFKNNRAMSTMSPETTTVTINTVTSTHIFAH